ncbi:SRPBCC domain-containing protein [Sphingomonas sp. MJ1 (PH-R8)]|uniref:SRPBCC domain-containing protein n=1 Tax=Sphingomonas sp. MJ1 (PH-R8) TaxID=3112950 RepID=UPI003A8A68C2
MNHELAIERVLDAPVTAIWQAWREHLEEWWCPLPWRTELHALELQAGGRFATTMISPDGERHDDEGLILEAIPQQRVVFTNALLPGWRPQPGNPFPFIGLFEFTPEGTGTRYRAAARHWTADDCETHRAMGFEDGWLAVAAQLEAVARRVSGLPAKA